MSLPDQGELFTAASIALAYVAVQMRGLGIHIGMLAAFGYRNNMIKTGALWIRMFQSWINLVFTDAAAPVIAIEYFSAIYWFPRRSLSQSAQKFITAATALG